MSLNALYAPGQSVCATTSAFAEAVAEVLE